jgi:hypothetical protein
MAALAGLAGAARAAEVLPPSKAEVWSTRKFTLAEGLWLEWKPTEEAPRLGRNALLVFRGKKIEVRSFADAREDEQLIGRNLEGKAPRLVRTRSDVGLWCSSQLSQLLRQATVPLVEEGADLVIAGKVTDFMVEERDSYRATVSLAVTVTDAAGKVRWSGEATGRAKNWGHSYSAENYLEVLSDALLQALDELMGKLANEPALARGAN